MDNNQHRQNLITILETLEITREDFDRIILWAYRTDPDLEDQPGFDYNDQWIINIFTDCTGRGAYSISDAINVYGLENVKSYCHEVLDRVEALCALVATR